MRPVRVAVADAAHPEGVELLQFDTHLAAVRCGCGEERSRWPSRGGPAPTRCRTRGRSGASPGRSRRRARPARAAARSWRLRASGRRGCARAAPCACRSRRSAAAASARRPAAGAARAGSPAAGRPARMPHDRSRVAMVCGRVDVDGGAVDPDRALPAAPLGQPGVVHHRARRPGPTRRCRGSSMATVRARKVRSAPSPLALRSAISRMVRIGSTTSTLHRPHRRRAVQRHDTRTRRSSARCPRRCTLKAASIDAAHGVVAHRSGEEERAVLGLAVEPVAVVVVRVARGRVGDRDRRTGGSESRRTG